MKLRRWLLSLFPSVLLVVLFMLLSPASWGQGGGGGGGSGGSHSSGMRHGSNAPRDSFGSTIVLCLVGAMISGGIIYALVVKTRVTNIVFTLQNGDAYGRKLEALTRAANFETPNGRMQALSALIDLVQTHDIGTGFVISHPCTGLFKLDAQAKELWQRQMRTANIKPPSNSSPTSPYAAPSFSSSSGTAPASSNTDSVCVVGLVLGARKTPLPDSQIAPGRLSLGLLKSVTPNAFYLYYAPDSSQHLTRQEAEALLTQLRRIVP